MDVWLRLTASALPKMPYLSYYVTAVLSDGTPDTDHPLLCAVTRPKPAIVPSASGKLIKCGVHATELRSLVDSNASAPALNSTAWRPISLYFNPEEAQLDTNKTYALVLQNCPLGECWLASEDTIDASPEEDSDYIVGTHATKPEDDRTSSLGSMVFRSGSWQSAPGTSVALAIYTSGSTEHGYRPNQLHEDWVAFHCNTTALEVKEMAQVAKTIPAYNSTNNMTIDVLAYSGYAGLGLGDPSSTTYYGDLRERYGVDWEVLTAAGLTVAMVGYGAPNVTGTQQLLERGSSAPGRADFVVPPLVCGVIAGAQATFTERYDTCDGAMEYDGTKHFDTGLDFHVPTALKTDDGAANRNIRVSNKTGKPHTQWNPPVQTGKTDAPQPRKHIDWYCGGHGAYDSFALNSSSANNQADLVDGILPCSASFVPINCATGRLANLNQSKAWVSGFEDFIAAGKEVNVQISGAAACCASEKDCPILENKEGLAQDLLELALSNNLTGYTQVCLSIFPCITPPPRLM